LAQAHESPIATSPRRRGRWWRRALGGLAFLAVLLAVARACLPWYLESAVNRALEQSPDYDGHVGPIDVHLWRGAYSIHDLTINRKRHLIPVPFFEDRLIDVRLDWASLLRGRARGRLLMDSPKINFVQGPSAEETQTGVDQPWLGMIDGLYPFRIDKAEIVGGEIHFRTFHTNPRVHVYLSDVHATIKNLTNAEDTTEPLIATVHARGTAMESGRFECEMSLDPGSHRPNFSLAARLLDVDVTRLNSLARAYGDFDFDGGRFDLVVEASAKDGFLEGYAKPLFRNVTVLSVRDIQKDDPLQLLWEALVGIVGAVFKNQARDQFGTRLSFAGDLDNPGTNILEIVGNVLRNAFVRAYLPRLEGRVAPDAAARAGPEGEMQWRSDEHP
jgi:hypothetical protein